MLESCYVSCLKLTKENDIHSIAFPLISAGIFGYPKDEAIDVAVDSIKKFFENDYYDIEVKIILFGSESVVIVERKFGVMDKCEKIKMIIDNNEEALKNLRKN